MAKLSCRNMVGRKALVGHLLDIICKSAFSVIVILSVGSSCITCKCVFEIFRGDKMYHFDLSSLNEFQYKEIDFIYQLVTYKMYLSLCKPLEGIPVMYLMQNGVEEPRIVVVKSTSQKSVPFISTTVEKIESKSSDDDDGVRLTISTSSQCEQFSQLQLNYSVNINFLCSMEGEEPSFEGLDVKRCLFSFKWLTPLACLSPYEPSNCSLQIDNYFFDLSALRQPFDYNSTIENVRMQINFCGPVNSAECQSTDSGIVSVCLIHNNETQYFNTKNLLRSSYSDKKESITFHYVSPPGAHRIFPSAMISLVCSTDSYAVRPKIGTKNHNRRLMVSVKTHLACVSHERCSVYDGIYKYSLPAETNVRIQHENATFLLSPCGSLKRDSFWLGSEPSAAMINGSVLSLGSMRRLSLTDDPKKLLLLLTGGSVCPGTQLRAKSHVKFSCAKKASGPFFLGRSKDCEFSFEWAHPSVCPVLAAESQNCIVRDPLLAYEFNLDPNRTFAIQGDGAVFKMNLCGERSEVCHSSTDASVCLVRGDDETIIGRRSSQLLLFEDGALVFRSAGEECRPGVPAQVYVNVVCDYGASDDSAPIFTGKDSDCVLEFTWNSRNACPEKSSVSCTAKNNDGGVVDLTPLRLTSSNYRIPKDEDSYFLINVCGSLWYGRGQTCLKGSGACLVNKKEFKSIGEVKEGPVFDGNQTKLIYKNKFQCRYPSAMDTTITFLCDLENEGPKHVGLENCTYNFVWKTEHACAAPTPKIEEASVPKIAAAPLPKIAGAPTPKITAAPIPKIEEASVPKITATPLAKITKTESVTVTHSPKAVKPTTSVVHSAPQNENHTEEMSDSSVALTDGQVPCLTRGSGIDLSVLRQVIVQLSTSTAYVNLCRPVNVPNGKCISDFSCLVFTSNKTLSLGSRFYQPVQSKNGLVTLKYFGGSTCEGDKRTNYSASLIFACNKSRGGGVPELRSPVASCAYTFLWETSVVCPDDAFTLDKVNCKLSNKNTSEVVNLLPVSNQKETKVESRSFVINICSADSPQVPCKGNICIKSGNDWVSGGLVELIGHYNYNFNRTVIQFNSGDACEGLTRYWTIVRLKCSRDERPWTLSEENCLFILELESPLACPSSLPQTSSSSHGTMISLLLVAAVVVSSAVGFVVFKWKSRFDFCCKKRSLTYESLLLKQGSQEEEEIDELKKWE